MTSPNTLWQLLEWRCEQNPQQSFLTEAQTDRVLSVAAFKTQAEALAKTLAVAGVGETTVVAWQMPTCIEAALLMFALSRLGAVQAPIIHLYREREINEVIAQAKPQFVVVKNDADSDARFNCAQAVIAALTVQPILLNFSELTASDDAADLGPYKPAIGAVRWYFFTSGTTARPKGAKHSDQSLLTGGFFLGSALDVKPDDIGSVAYPIAHIGGVVYLSMVLKAGCSVILLNNYLPDFVIRSFNKYQVTLGGGSTAHYQVMLEEQRKQPDTPLFPSVRLLAGGGAAKPAALFWQVKEELGIRIIHAYGMTEAPITSSNTPYDTDEQLTNTDGEVLPELELKIVDGQGKRVNPGEAGEILLRGGNLCQGYLLDEQTANAFDDEGFYHTGDLGKMDFDGHLSITGRLKEVIIRKGENISAREIEELLAKHPAIKDAAVIGLPDEDRGEMVCAVVELVDTVEAFTMPVMQEFLESHQLMRQKIPERLEVLKELPRNEGLQKVKKNALVAQFS